jgi:DNA-binding winged helix-turn-helix (wHTH) protein/predicted small integral membrane protein
MSENESYSYFFDDFCLRCETRALYVKGKKSFKTLASGYFEVLRILIENPGQHYKIDEIGQEKDLEKKGLKINQKTRQIKDLQVVINYLRDLLHDFQKDIIINDRGKGYRFVPEVKKVPDKEIDFSDPFKDLTQAQDIPPEPEIPADTAITLSPSKEGLKTFEKWLGGDGKTIKWVLFSCVALSFISSLALSLSSTAIENSIQGVINGEPVYDPSNWTKTAAAFMQCVTIFIALAYAWKTYKPKVFSSPIDENKDDKFKESLNSLSNSWRSLLGLWVLLYLFLVVYFGVESLQLSNILSASSDRFTLNANLSATLFNYLNTLAIIYCFILLNKQGQGADEENANYRYLILTTILCGLTILGHLFFGHIKNVSNGLDLFTGIIAGTAMALFVGRLQSKFLGARPWLLIFLYSYTALQPLYFYLTTSAVPDVLIVLLMNFYLILKCLLYLYMAWTFESTRLLFYLVEIREKHKDIESDWEIWLSKL